jgi:cell division protein FtsB
MRNISVLLGRTAAIFLLTGCGGETKQLQAENEALHAEVAALKARTAEVDATRDAELKRAQADAQDVARLRGEITQLRNSAKDTEKLRAENQQLKSENQKLRGGAATPAAPTPAPPPVSAEANFPRESWAFFGYGSPDAALMSAIWSMQQGNPKQYFDSLTAEEQARMAKTWENKSEAEIAAKHQADVSRITGMRVLNRQEISADEIQMSVYIDGVDRTDKVSMKRVGNEWKFGGFIREQPKQ